MNDQQGEFHKAHLWLVGGLASVFASIFAILTIAPMFITFDDNALSLILSMKDATVNIMMIIVGYAFGSSSSSRAKDLKPEDKKEF